MNTSIKWKIISIFVLLQILILGIMGLYLTTNIKGIFFQQMEKNMQKDVKLITELLKPDLQAGNLTTLQQKTKVIAQKIEGRITVIAPNGTVLADSEENPAEMEEHSNRPEIIDAARHGKGTALRFSTTIDKSMKYFAEKVEPYGFVRLAIPASEVINTLFSIMTKLLVGFGIAFSLFFILAWRVSESITEPIERITKTARKIAHGNLNERIHIYTKDEIGTLSRMFNMMAYQLSETIKNITNEKERLSTILENMADGLIALDAAQHLILINPAAAQIFNVRKDDVLGKTLIEMNRNQLLTEAVLKAYNNRELVDVEIQLIYPKEVILRVHIAPITRNLTKPRGMVLIFTDITELRRLERLRTEFVGNVSHELKTPLTSIRGYVETLLDMEIDDPLVNRFLAVINKESDRLARLINDLLDLSRLEGKRHHQLLPTGLGDVVENVISVLTPEAQKKEISLQIDLPPDLPRVMGIEEQLNQVLINLVDNGIKYTPVGGWVKVSADVDTDWVTLKVADNGMGIPAEDSERIFERFYRVDKARSRSAGGTGLGLSIVKHIVKAHGGDISVDSDGGQGSIFKVKLKREKK